MDITQVLVLVDDIDIDFGAIRLRQKGSAGTHNGLKDIGFTRWVDEKGVAGGVY